MRRRGVRGFLTLLITLVLIGCTAPVDDEPDPSAVVVAAVDALAGQSALAYRISADTILNVTRGGLVHGRLPLMGGQVQALRAGGDLYLLAPQAYWQARGMPATRAAEYGARWARVAPETVSFDPGRLLTPAQVSGTLRLGLPNPVRPVRSHLADGTAVFDVGGLQVTALPPYRVVSLAPALLGPVVAESFGTGPVSVDGFTGASLTELRTAFGDAVAGLGQPFVAGPVIATTITGSSLNCGTSGSCTDRVRVGNQLLGQAPKAAARLVFNSSVTSDLGSRTCGQEVVVPVNTSTELACSVEFELPRANGSTNVVAAPSITAEPVATVDADALHREVAAELGG
jgi:hypothetical protein